jgi:hypothetical protein
MRRSRSAALSVPLGIFFLLPAFLLGDWGEKNTRIMDSQRLETV